MAFIAYSIIWVSVLIFSGYMTLKTGNYNFLWFIAIPTLMQVRQEKHK